MFDLFRSRDKAVRYILGGVLTLVALSMVVTLIPGFGSGSAGGSEQTIVAEIGGDPLTVREVQTTLQAAMRDKPFPPEMIQIYIPQLVDQMISERALAYQAERMGFQVTDEDVARAIRTMIPMVFQDGRFNRDMYMEFLSRQNLSIPEFESNVKKNLLLLKLQNLAIEGVVVNPKEIEDEFRRRNDKVKVDYIEFTPDKFRSQVQVSKEEIEQEFNKDKASFRVPEKRTFDLIIADESRAGEGIDLPEAELRAAYDLNKDRYRLQERVKVRHILVKTEGKPKEEAPKLEAKANDLLKQIKGGADFAKLAKENSEDTGSAPRGGDLDWVVRGQTVKAFEETAYKLKPKEISDVVKTEYGFHIIQVMEKEEARIRPFEEVKAELAAEKKRQFVLDRVQRTAEQARTALMSTPDRAREIAAQLKLTYHRAEKVATGDPLQEIGVHREFESVAWGLPKNGVTPVLSAPGNKLVLGVVADIIPSRQAEFADVEKDIRTRLETTKGQNVAMQKAAEAVAKAKAGTDIKQLAKSYGLEAKTTPEFDRTGEAQGIGTATYLNEAFTSDVGAVFGPLNIGDRRFVVRVAGKSPADLNRLATERDNVRMSLKRQKALARKELFEDGLVTELIREGKVKRYDAAIQRLRQNYRS
jgi:peptidyl-prolyl cis-trans isomerase D